MKHVMSAAVLGTTVAMSSLSFGAYNGHPISGFNYYEIDVQPMTTNDPQSGANIEAYNLLPFLPLPPPPTNIADPFMINGFIVLAQNDAQAAGIFGGWLSGQISTEDLRNMSVGTMHSKCTDIGGAYAGNGFPALLFTVTDEPQEEPNLVTQCIQVANFNGEQLTHTGLSNDPAWEGNWQSCWNAPPAPVTTELAVTGGTGYFLRARGQKKVNAVKLEVAPGVCQRPGPVKRLKWNLWLW